MGDAATFPAPRPPRSTTREAGHLELIGERVGGGGLPAQPSPLIGREAELAAARSSITAGDARLLTFTGPGGAGKTRLAVEAAASLQDELQGAVTFVDLAPVGEPALVAAAIAEALDVRETANEALEERLKRALHGRRVLLVLDNFEHVIAAAPLVARLLAACPELRVLATSRVPLHLRWEQVLVVPPLGLPDPARLPPPDELAAVPAVALFVDRARAARGDFALDEQNARAVAELCVRLDGLPLAIQLAASRSRMFAPEAMLRRLARGLDLLSEGARDLPPRQRSLRAAIEWSYDLLAPDERAVFRRLAAFAGGFSVEAAEEVCTGAESPRETVAGGLEALLTQSLLGQAVAEGDEPRFAILETIREYALERLIEHDEAGETGRRHAAHFLALAERAAGELHGPREAAWLGRLAQEHDNLRAALHWLLVHGAPGDALRLAGALWPFWHVRGHWREGREKLAAALAREEERAFLRYRAEALFGAATLARFQGDHAAAGAQYAECLALWRALGDRRGEARGLAAAGGLARQRGERAEALNLFEASLAVAHRAGDRGGAAQALNDLGIAAAERGELAEARRLLEASLGPRRDVGDRRGVASSLLNLGNVLRDQRDAAGARERYEESLQLFRELGSKLGISSAATNLGTLAYSEGRYAAARALYEESLEIRRAVGDRAGAARALEYLGKVALARGEVEAAELFCTESLELRHALQDREGTASALVGLSGVAAARSQPDRALRLDAAAAALRKEVGAASPPDAEAMSRSRQRAARRALGERESRAAWETGLSMSEAEALAYALAPEGRSERASVEGGGRDATAQALADRRGGPEPGTVQAPLTAREREVARLVAQGLTNREIGERLVVTTGTAALHVEHIRRKLGFHARAQIASWVALQTWPG